MIQDPDPMPWEAVQALLDRAARARRLAIAIAIAGDPAAPRLEQIADELDAKIARYARFE
jgi:hypothetical protein